MMKTLLLWAVTIIEAGVKPIIHSEFWWCPSFHRMSLWTEDTRDTSCEQGFYTTFLLFFMEVIQLLVAENKYYNQYLDMRDNNGRHNFQTLL
jgi:hypothetical protein